MAHAIACAGAGCREFSVHASFEPVDPAEESAAHRSALAEEGWTDREARDYCPNHSEGQQP